MFFASLTLFPGVCRCLMYLGTNLNDAAAFLRVLELGYGQNTAWKVLSFRRGNNLSRVAGEEKEEEAEASEKGRKDAELSKRIEED